jgi:phage terminase large subunit-like protein
MPRIDNLTLPQRQALLEKVLKLFLLFCRQEFQTELYRYQVRVARALLSSLLVEPKDVYVKIARQAGKTEVLTLLFKFLLIYFIAFLERPLMAAIASPKGEQAKTDLDRIKKSVQQLKERWNLEDRENNQATIRAYRHDQLTAEMYRFSLMPTTSLESKTLNVLAVEESHKADHQKISDECDPMLASTGGITWHFGVGCVQNNAFKKGCDGELPDSLVVWVDVEEVVADRRAMFERTQDASHLAYEK